MSKNSLQRERMRTARRWWKNAPWLPAVVLIFIQLAGGMRDMSQMAFFPIYLKEQLGLRTVIISSIVAGAQVAGMVMALLGGALTARLGSKWMLVCGLAGSCLGSLAFQVHSPWLVGMLWFLSGAGLAMVTVGGASYLTRISAGGGLGLLAAFYALSMTVGGAVGNPLAGIIIERYGFQAFSWAVLSLSTGTILIISLLMPGFQDQRTGAVPLRSFWSGLLLMAGQKKVRLLAGLRGLPTIFYGMLTVLIPLLLNDLSGSKVLVAVYGTTNLVVASAAQLLAGRAADRWGARPPTLAAYSGIILSGLGLALFHGTVWGLFLFGVIGIAAAWSLSTMMYLWVNDGIAKPEHPSTFGLLHAVWSLSMITGTVLGGWFVSTLPGLPFLAAGLFNVGSLFLIFIYYEQVAVKNAQTGGQEVGEA